DKTPWPAGSAREDGVLVDKRTDGRPAARATELPLDAPILGTWTGVLSTILFIFLTRGQPSRGRLFANVSARRDPRFSVAWQGGSKGHSLTEGRDETALSAPVGLHGPGPRLCLRGNRPAGEKARARRGHAARRIRGAAPASRGGPDRGQQDRAGRPGRRGGDSTGRRADRHERTRDDAWPHRPTRSPDHPG